MDKAELLGELALLRRKLEAAVAEEERLHDMIRSLSEQVNVQAEMLGRAAEVRGVSADRVRELEDALAPLAALLANGWDAAKRLPDTAVYPVPMAVIRQAAKVLAGTSHNKAA
jgi:hypothetical protein